MHTVNPKGAVKKRAKPRAWTEADLIFLKENYNKYTNEVLSKELGRSDSSITDKYRKTFSRKETPSIKNVKVKRPMVDWIVSTDLVMYILSKNQGIGIRDCVDEIIKATN